MRSGQISGGAHDSCRPGSIRAAVLPRDDSQSSRGIFALNIPGKCVLGLWCAARSTNSTPPRSDDRCVWGPRTRRRFVASRGGAGCQTTFGAAAAPKRRAPRTRCAGGNAGVPTRADEPPGGRLVALETNDSRSSVTRRRPKIGSGEARSRARARRRARRAPRPALRRVRRRPRPPASGRGWGGSRPGHRPGRRPASRARVGGRRRGPTKPPNRPGVLERNAYWSKFHTL